jgi:hypothetical protein
MQLVRSQTARLTGLQPDAVKAGARITSGRKNRLGTDRYLPLGDNAVEIVDNTNGRGIECSERWT